MIITLTIFDSLQVYHDYLNQITPVHLYVSCTFPNCIRLCCSQGICFELVSTWNIWSAIISWQADGASAWTLPVVLLFWEVSGDCLSLWHRMPAGVHGARGEVTVWHLFSSGMRRYCDTRLCTSMKTGTAVTSPKIVKCNRWCYALLHIC